MSLDGVSYRAAGVDYDALDAGKRLAMARPCPPPAARAPGGRARSTPRAASRRSCSSSAERTLRVRGRGPRHEVDHRPRRARASRGSTASPTSPTTRSRRSSTTSAAWARCRWSSTPTSPPAPRSGIGSPSAPQALLEGWRRACADAGCAWGGGESPSLPGLLDEREIELAGAAVGVAAGGTRADPRRASLAPGDEIVLVASSGLHANGASLARLVAAAPARGLRHATARTARTLRRGAARARRSCTCRWSPRCSERRAPVTYISHITGHGLLKLMRPRSALTYRIERLPRGAGGAASWSRPPAWTRGRRLLDVQHGLRATPLYCAARWRRGRRRSRRGLGLEALRRGARRGGAAAR